MLAARFTTRQGPTVHTGHELQLDQCLGELHDVELHVVLAGDPLLHLAHGRPGVQHGDRDRADPGQLDEPARLDPADHHLVRVVVAVAHGQPVQPQHAGRPDRHVGRRLSHGRRSGSRRRAARR
ncbi:MULTISPECIES: hypothetical protein [Saccharothrix]|uniref:hypothetical protein n=1 Tax=Saccharothrix TaxID=2071 RepID=UPI001160FDB9|nr:hypothetical protein [Saccharothrix sp. CB00851]